MKSFLKLFFIVFIVAGCTDQKQKPGTGSTLQKQIEIEKVKLTSLKGEQIDLKQYKGKTVFLNFWATWCKPCVLEMPTIKNALDSLKNQDIEFLFASDETAEDIERFENKYNYHFNYFRVANIEELEIMILPTTFIFDKNGNLVFSDIGYQKWDDRSKLDMLLKFANQK